MIGVFDSGVGGLTALYRLRELKPDVDLCYLADRENAPYGTKSEKQILGFVKRDIERLCEAGVNEGILIACCTASAVYDSLSSVERSMCLPIIKPAAECAVKLSERGRIGVISTEATHRSGVFIKEISKSGKEAISLPLQRLVSLVEGGASDGKITPSQKQIIREELSPLFFSDIDVLILGCTHFTHIRRAIEDTLGVLTVSPSLIGAETMAERVSTHGSGKTVFL